MSASEGEGPLKGLRVLDIATIIAGPMAATMMADFGAEVIKLELPGVGDGLRGFPPFREGKSLWWKVTNRGKYFGTLDLRKEAGKELFLRMVAKSDVVVENFRPGTLERWGLDVETLWAANPRLVILRLSGFGQDGPYKEMSGLARIFEAMGGLTEISGSEDGPPMHTGYPIGDPIGGLFGAFAIMAALWRVAQSDRETGEEIDLALTEALFRIIEVLAIEYDQLGEVRQRSGNRNLYSAPSDVYLTADKRYVTVAGSTARTFSNNARAIDRADLIDDPRFADNASRVTNAVELDRIFGSWIASHTQEEAVNAFRATHGTLAPIYSVDQIFTDPQFVARQAITAVEDEDFGSVRMQGLVPRFKRHPGKIRWAAKGIAADNDHVFKEIIGLDDWEIEEFKVKGVI
ncbi:MAG: CoA transferase [Sneathiella sp.]|jgi:crotonobetainyl-CoA:carnitine CoA-transferase CaiB-like acyl-CoA transferase|uniref:CaiB/BaiF CoA transferase family protein n=1 Tax=Sneathiella sp. TaxID=1964365 RepID=UPI000C59B703|nr:CoA transferase [Sneathiella sp.]MAL77761.1 CoA transferase [Sneathiella sp.]|tara:strand:+ start:339 stop:1550 length:1212 start_codon:yes stop_codon:yes gene_type:complete